MKGNLVLSIVCYVIKKAALLDSVGEGEGGMIWENGIATCIISYKKRISSPGSMQDNRKLGAGALGLPRGMVWGGRWEGG